jgi:hypothetical protein
MLLVASRLNEMQSISYPTAISTIGASGTAGGRGDHAPWLASGAGWLMVRRDAAVWSFREALISDSADTQEYHFPVHYFLTSPQATAISSSSAYPSLPLAL